MQAVPRVLFAVMFVFATALGTPGLGPVAAAQDTNANVKVLARARLGNNTEAATIPRTGALKDSIVIVDGHDLLSIRLNDDQDVQGQSGAGQSSDKRAKKIMDLRTLPIDEAIRGIAHVDGQDIFVAQEPLHLTTLFAFDDHGRVLPSRTITYPSGFTPFHVEGITYVPSSASRYGDRLISIVYDLDFEPHLQVIRLDGVVEATITSPALAGTFIAGIGYRAPDHLLISSGEASTIWTLDFDGNVVERVEAATPIDLEGVAQASDGRIYVTPYFGGQVLAFDSSLQRTPVRDRSYAVGIGAALPCCLAWDTRLERFVVYQLDPENIYSLPISLDSKTPLIDSSKFGSGLGITYLPDEKLIGVTKRGTRKILLFDDQGTSAGEVNVPSVPCSTGSPTCATQGRIAFASYLPSLRQFVFRMQGRADPKSRHLLHFADRSGTFVRSLDVGLAPLNIQSTHIAVPYRGFGDSQNSGAQNATGQNVPGPEQLLIMDDNAARLVLTDLQGMSVKWTIDMRRQLNTVNPNGLAQITSGKYAGAIAVADTENSEVIIVSVK